MNFKSMNFPGRLARLLGLLITCLIVSGYSGCESVETYAVGLKANTFIRDYTKMSQAERDAFFKTQIEPLTEAGKSGALDLLLGESALYLSPEQQTAMFSNESSVMWGLGAMALASGFVQPGTDQFLLFLKDYGASLPTQIKALTKDTVDPRIAALKARFGDYYDALDSTTVRQLIWDDTLFQSVMTSNQAAFDILAAGTYGNTDRWTGDALIELQNHFLPTTTTAVTQPPS